MIGRYAKTKKEMGDVKLMVSWAELYYLAPKKRTITWANLVFNPKLVIWVWSSNSGTYFQQEGCTDNTGIRRIINQGRAFLAYDAEQEWYVNEGMKMIGQNYGIEKIDYYKHYLPLIERSIELEIEENMPKGEKSVARIQALKREINEIIKR